MKVKHQNDVNPVRNLQYTFRRDHAAKCKKQWKNIIRYVARISPKGIEDPEYKNIRYKASDYADSKWFDHLPFRWNHDDLEATADSVDIFTNNSWKGSDGKMYSMLEINKDSAEGSMVCKYIDRNIRRDVSLGSYHIRDEDTGAYVLGNQAFEISLCDAINGAQHSDCKIFPHSDALEGKIAFVYYKYNNSN